jgi:hypothetical protein
MNEQNDEKWLDELISQTINTTKPHFDAEQWRRKFPEEFELLKSRAGRRSAPAQQNVWKAILQNRFATLAASAAIIVTISLFITHLRPGARINIGEVPKVAESPAEMLTMMSLTMAYRRGGMEALEKQCDKALAILGPRNIDMSIQKLLEDLNG